jgi:hypothetical protein
MEKHKKAILSSIFVLFIGLLVLPVIQRKFELINIKPLHGAFKKTEIDSLSIETVLNGEYQEKVGKNVKENIGFRSLFVRINNQIDFSLFHKTNATSVLFGKDDYLFEQVYIDAYYGNDFKGEKFIKNKVYKLAKVVDTLEKLGKPLLIVIAPNKVHYYPEKISDNLKQSKNDSSNYEYYLEGFNKHKLNIIDVNKWFVNEKATTEFPLFAKTGIHWSRYGEITFADSLTKKLEKISGKDIPNLLISGNKISDKPVLFDNDLEVILNLFSRIDNEPLAYPEYSYETYEGKDSLKTMVVSDSFYWGLFNSGYSKNVLAGGRFWYYFMNIYPNDTGKELLSWQLDLKENIEKNDAIVIICTEGNLAKFSFGFINRAFLTYFPEEDKKMAAENKTN